MQLLNEQVALYLERLKQENNLRALRKYSSKEQYLLDLSSNDYLNLSKTPWQQVCELGIEQSNDKLGALVQEFLADKTEYRLPCGSTGSRLLSGDNTWIEKIEDIIGGELEAYDKQALFYNSGYHANMGIVPALAKINPESTYVLMDKLIHASLIDGVLLSGVKLSRFSHNNLQDLENKLIKAVDKGFANIIICLESIYSMDGDNLDQSEFEALVALKAKYSNQANIILYVDEAHAVGLFGEHALGLVDKFKVIKEIDIIVCPLGKATNSSGALVLTNQILREFLINTSRPLIYSTALGAETILATALNFSYARNKLVKEKVTKLLNLADDFRQHLCACLKEKYPDLDALALVYGNNQIISFVVGSNDNVLYASKALREKGVLVGAIKSPTVPKHKERLRLCLNTSLVDKAELYQFLKQTFKDLINDSNLKLG
ncbi:hypothetical protein CJP74_06405 [Psittacicella melopsittaci]|uniref:Aminotransferase class I/classII large domain-containing protein n=1 Tax=Psittacicella melopsittaci TaxID=2028576 RepID=A0A3A1Y3K4_9GAMM|nr:aminotransferase class I/II-fold pyridoxal phosphate-dependent enzyme [Psittacicella melopsittaci]RIY31798.1 hypothetical protein CJP74_06405 [Psittacicella melopsittaci]